MKRLLLLLIPIFLLLPGCASFQIKKAKERIATNCNSLIGKTEEEVILALGAPEKTEQLGGLTIYHYYQSFGKVSDVYLNPYCGFGNAVARDTYDKFDLVFKRGILVSWTSDVQR